MLVCRVIFVIFFPPLYQVKKLISDAGKSTIGGQIMSLTGMVDKRTLEKYEREAREKSRESWYLSWALDTNQEGKERREKKNIILHFFNVIKKMFSLFIHEIINN